MAEMTTTQRHWFAGVMDATMDLKVYHDQGPTKKYVQMEVTLGPFGGRASVADRLVDFLGNGWVQNGHYFQLRGYEACRGLFQEVWGDLTHDTRAQINGTIRHYKAETKGA